MYFYKWSYCHVFAHLISLLHMLFLVNSNGLLHGFNYILFHSYPLNFLYNKCKTQPINFDIHSQPILYHKIQAIQSIHLGKLSAPKLSYFIKEEVYD